ncbi:transposase [Klebsiella sp. KE9767]|uniref:transposase n=1 Tax=Klebsiella sp. KE9767 TaxID=3118151 RepID=UPI00375117FC
MKKRFSDEQIISILREAEAGVSARELCRKHAISDATFYTWRNHAGRSDRSKKIKKVPIRCSHSDGNVEQLRRRYFVEKVGQRFF